LEEDLKVGEEPFGVIVADDVRDIGFLRFGDRAIPGSSSYSPSPVSSAVTAADRY
jgi:hypothetical protein